MTRLIDRGRAAAERHPLAVDSALAVLLGGLAAANGVLTAQQFPAEELPGAGTIIVLSLLVTFPLAGRRRAPLTVAALTAAAFTVHRFAEVPESAISSLALFLALVSAGAYGKPRRTRDLVRALVFAAMLALLLVQMLSDAFSEARSLAWLQAFTLVFNLVFFIAAWVLGDLMRTRTERERLLAQRTGDLEREREENARRAVVEERLRIARELHDVVAHHVSVMGVQAGAARRVLRSRPDRAEEALAAVEDTSRSAVGELQRMVGLLRQADDDETPRQPQPGVRDLGRLAFQMREAGLPVELVVEGGERPLPTAVDLSAYRIVQEALTNTLRHAGRAHASVEVRYRGDRLEMEIRDDGRGAPSPALVGAPGALPSPADRGDGSQPRLGHGIPGMRERVSLLGGDLDLGPNPGGGFRVRVTLPLDPPAPR